MKTSTIGLKLIQRFEGFEPQLYRDAAGYWTIGYGHLVRSGESFREGVNQAQAEALLKRDVQVAERAVHRLIQGALSQAQFDALVSFTFNLGSGALQRSTLRRKVNGGYHAEVPAELMRWVWAGGRRLRGLIRRRKAEAKLYSA